MNEGKRGHPYEFPESMMRFMAAVRQMEGFLWSLSKVVEKVKMADY